MQNIYIISKNAITLVIDGETKTLASDNPYYKEILEEVHKPEINWELLKKYMDIKRAVLNYIGENLTIKDREFIYTKNGKPLKISNNSIIGRIIDGNRKKRKVEHLIKFLDKVLSNPIESAREELFLFLEAMELPILDNGNFLAYKRVREDYKDVYSGKFDNSIGKTVKMDRKKCDTDRYRTCSYGLHFCSKSYLTSYSGQRIVVVEVNPADVVAIPSDYNNAKGRACKYKVIGEVTDQDLDLTRFTNTQRDLFEDKVDFEPVTKEGLPIFETVKDARYGMKNRKIGQGCYVFKKDKNEYRLYRFVNGTENKDLIRIS